MTASAPVAELPLSLLRQFDVPGPRYTSYPTADRFIEAFDGEALESWLHARRLGTPPPPAGVYVHVPFCASLCHYCACNKIITRDYSKGVAYLDDLRRELDIYQRLLGSRLSVSRLHLGGGSPTFLDDESLHRLMVMMGEHFRLDVEGERSIEVDPRTVDRERVRALAQLGFNRVSFGVQDFDPDVQQAVHRVQSTEQVFAVVQAAREAGFRSTNVDLIYGLPRQTATSFAQTLATLRELRPDRIALYGYAHLPARFKPQRRIDAAELPDAESKLKMLHQAIFVLQDAGYEYIGMDHFALPEDSLTQAKRQGLLKRNFQGYTDQPDGDLIGLGVSAIGKIGPTYAQNARTLSEYRELLGQGRLPVMKGIELNGEDLMRRAIIMALMCQGCVSFEAIEVAHLVDFHRHFAHEMAELRAYRDMGLVEIDKEWITVTPQGWYVVRAIAMVFDRHLQHAQDRVKFSRVL
ncbi:MAG: oxygen-independent coproporphyrinogen III oxidase [Moraxellaceae bacterium]|nr:oxygen-independent coproporphyrinogen III oxidase [Moraxellaceae bacterium]